jgi:hypothetical protein
MNGWAWVSPPGWTRTQPSLRIRQEFYVGQLVKSFPERDGFLEASRVGVYSLHCVSADAAHRGELTVPKEQPERHLVARWADPNEH